MEKKSYAVLMEQHKISENINVLRPLYLISGRDTGEDFENEIKEFYSYSTDTNTFVFHENELTVAYIISEEELKGRCPGVSLEEAKMNYFSEINESIHLGYYNGITDKVTIHSFNAESLEERLRIQRSEKESDDSENSDSKQDVPIVRMDSSNRTVEKIDTGEAYIVDEIIPIIVSDFKKILDIREDEKLREVLESLYKQFQNGEMPLVNLDESELYPTLVNQKITKRKIISFFTSICERMITAGSLEQISKLETNIRNSLNQIIFMLDAYGKNEIPVEAATEILYRIIDEFALITASRDINRIKLEVADVFKNEESAIEQVATIYEEYESRATKSLERVKSSRKGSSYSSSITVNAKDLKRFFDRRIAGQEEAKKTIISAVVMNALSEEASDRISCFLVGPPGSGKTLIAETLGEYLDIPYEIIDTTQLTSPGYVGRDIEDFLARLISKAGGDIERAERGIVVFDELDKKGSEKKSDISGRAVLNTLLSFFQGTNYLVKKGQDKVTFNTSRLTIFATGACVDVAKAKLQKEGLGLYKKTTIGFVADVSSKEEEDFVYPELEPEDFSKYGGISDELMGRITTICQLSGHTVETLKFILTNIETSSLLLLQKKLLKIGISLSWTEEYLDAVAHRAIKLKTGARSLKSTVEKSVSEARWEVLTNMDKYSGILLTEECVEQPDMCKLITKDGSIVTVKEVSQDENSTKKVKKIGEYQ